MDKEYVVTLYRREDLEQFYAEMQLSNFPLARKRPISRNTHYMMTEEQAERLRQDPRVWGVIAVDDIVYKTYAVNNEPYAITGRFWKSDTVDPAQIADTDYQWGHIHCAGDQVQRGKNQFGKINPTEYQDHVIPSGTYENVTDAVEVFNNGRHVDVVIVDDPVAYDSAEWKSPTTGETRFVQYQWFNELNTWIAGPDGDDDGITPPTGTITYGTNATSTSYHGIHVTGTVAGQHYGWAKEANIYNLAVTGAWPSGQIVDGLLIFDYLRGFHSNKSVNPQTGIKNPTVTNHSYGSSYNLVPDVSTISFIVYRGNSYSALNPGPSGWTNAGIESDFGIRFNENTLAWNAAEAADVQDAIAEGIIIIGAAGNSNYYIDVEGGDDWDNYFTVSGSSFPYYYHRGSSPNTPDSGSIIVGAMSNDADFRRATFTNYGPGIDVFAPGVQIVSSFGNTGLDDLKPGYGTGNYFYPISGTSMASPQVCGAAAILSTGKSRYNNSDVRAYLQKTSIYGEMTFDAGHTVFNQGTFGVLDLYVKTTDNNSFKIHSNGAVDRAGNSFTWDNNPKIVMMEGDLLYLRRQGTVNEPSNPQMTVQVNVFFEQASSYELDCTWDRENMIGVASDPSFTIELGDTIEITIGSPVSVSPMYIKTALSSGTSNQASGATGQGAANQGDTLTFTPTAAGTYYYQSSTNYNANGTITVVAAGTYSGNHPLWIKTALGSGSTNALPSNPAADAIVSGNGSSYYNPVIWPAAPGGNDPVTFTSNGMAGTYYYQCGNHQSMYGELEIIPRPVTAGGYDDFTARLGSPNKCLHVENPRPIVGYVGDVRGERKTEKTNQTFPRPTIYNRKALGPDPQTYTLSVRNDSSSDWRWVSGTDRSGVTFDDTATYDDWTLNFYAGDTIQITNNAGSIHPFYIKTSATTGTGNQVTTGTITGNGASLGNTVEWDTTGVSPGTYYYVCSNHSGMQGQIIIS